MAITTTTVNMTALLPDDAAPDSATVTFSLSSPGWEGDAVIPDAVTVDLDANGDGSVSLWANAANLAVYTFYRVTVSYYRAAPFSADRIQTKRLGSIYVPTTGPVGLGDLFKDFSASTSEDWGLVTESADQDADWGLVA